MNGLLGAIGRECEIRIVGPMRSHRTAGARALGGPTVISRGSFARALRRASFTNLASDLFAMSLANLIVQLTVGKVRAGPHALLVCGLAADGHFTHEDAHTVEKNQADLIVLLAFTSIAITRAKFFGESLFAARTTARVQRFFRGAQLRHTLIATAQGELSREFLATSSTTKESSYGATAALVTSDVMTARGHHVASSFGGEVALLITDVAQEGKGAFLANKS